MSIRSRMPRTEGWNPQWREAKTVFPPTGQVKKLIGWQNPAYETLKDARYGFLAAFCGSGKTVVEIALAIYDILSSGWEQKQLIFVPQQHIHRGFVGDGDLDYISMEIEGKTYQWKIGHNFCEGGVGVLKRLKSWLLADGKSLGSKFSGGTVVTGLNAVTSHQALGLVWKTLTDAEKEQAIRSLSLRGDEAHHVSGVFDDEEEGLSPEEKLAVEQERTNLGDVCGFIMNSSVKSSKIHLATATPFRGDRKSILFPAVKDVFVTYRLDWVDHFHTLGIEHFYLEYEEYQEDPIGQIVARVSKEPNEKHMIIVPASGDKWRLDGSGDLNRLLQALRSVVHADRILDLVTPSTQSENKRRLLDEPKVAGGRPSAFDVVVTCMLGREGTDWCPCSRLHNSSCENSITLALQTFGRPLRRFDGKTNVHVYHYVHRFAQPAEGMTKRELLSDRTNALMVCMELDEMTYPIIFPEIAAKESRDGERSQGSRRRPVDVFGDQYQQVKRDLLFRIEGLEDKTDKSIRLVISDILNDYGVSEDVEDVSDSLLAVVSRVFRPDGVSCFGIDVKFVRERGFDKIVEEYGIRDKSIFFGTVVGEDWKTIRAILKDKWDVVLDEYSKRYLGWEG